MSRVLLEVTSMMSSQLGGLHESTTAHVANEVLLVGVDTPVHCQSVGPLEGFAANVALIRPSVAVRYQMTLEQILRSEQFHTYVALVKRLSVTLSPYNVPVILSLNAFVRSFLEFLSRQQVYPGTLVFQTRSFLLYAIPRLHILVFNENRIRTFMYRRFIFYTRLRWSFISENKIK